MTEHSPVGSSQSNGMTERRIQTIEGQIRALRSAFEARTKAKLPTSSCLFTWMTFHAANRLNLCEVGKDGKVPFQRLRGRRMHAELVESGERVHYQPLNYKSLGSAQPRWVEGVYIGMKINTGEKLIATTNHRRSLQSKIDKKKTGERKVEC
jgi:hypothetical protein